MRVVRITLIMATLGFLSISVVGAEAKSEIKNQVESFYREYIQLVEKQQPEGKWIENNAGLTKSFKSAYAKCIAHAEKEEGLDSDPILNAQDIPASEFKATTINVNGVKATVNVKSSDWPDHSIRVNLLKVQDKWLINSINEINKER